MHIDWRGYLATPLTVVADYVTVMEGEALALERAQKGKQTHISDAPPGFDLELAEPEIIGA